MRKPPLKSQLKKAKPIVLTIDPKELRNGIILPKVSYKVVLTPEQEKVFSGLVVPIPKVLMYFLSHMELKVLFTILEESFENKDCGLSVIEMAARLKVAPIRVSSALYSMRKMGLLFEEPNGKSGTGKFRKLNYDALQHLNDLVEGEDPGIYSRIRKATRKIDILHMTRKDVEISYDTKVLPPDHDPIEEEEYD